MEYTRKCCGGYPRFYSNNGDQIQKDQGRIDRHAHIAVEWRETPTSNDKRTSGFKAIIVAGPVGHPGTGAEGEEEGEGSHTGIQERMKDEQRPTTSLGSRLTNDEWGSAKRLYFRRLNEGTSLFVLRLFVIR